MINPYILGKKILNQLDKILNELGIDREDCTLLYDDDTYEIIGYRANNKRDINKINNAEKKYQKKMSRL